MYLALRNVLRKYGLNIFNIIEVLYSIIDLACVMFTSCWRLSGCLEVSNDVMLKCQSGTILSVMPTR